MADDKSPFSSTTVNYAATGGTGKSTRQRVSVADLGGSQTGQTFEERKQAGRAELAIWIPEEMKASLPKLAQAMGKKHPKEAVEQAIRDAMDRYLA